jgi:tRNA modification GTPase
MSDAHPADTIVARATPPGHGAIAIVRLSGPLTERIVSFCFRKFSGLFDWDSSETQKFQRGVWLSPDTARPIDDILLVIARTPNSYTGEDLCEIHCHGSPVIVEEILNSCLQCSARLAGPGEFTRRAFLNGRIDLVQAEAVCDLIAASTEAARRLAFRQIKGKVSAELSILRSQLVTIIAEIEARLDFADEQLEPLDRGQLLREMQLVNAAIETLIEHAHRGRLTREGARVVICGRPNTGKSSLLNALAGRERAIVTPHPGATRDSIECTLDIGGFALTFVDTAGLHATDDPIEQLGVERAHREIEDADLALWLIDGAEPLREEDLAIAQRLQAVYHLTLLNKADLPAQTSVAQVAERTNDSSTALAISALRGDGLERLEAKILDCIIGKRDGVAPEGVLIANARHVELLKRASKAMRHAHQRFQEDVSGEFITVELNEALNALSEILGLSIGEDVLDRIFSNFCIGK